MSSRIHPLAFPLLSFVLLSAGLLEAQSVPASSPDFFETKIRPVFVNNCSGCHTASALGGLRVDSREALIKGGRRGAAIVPGDPEKSLLITAIKQTTDLKMPQGGKLKAAEVADIEAWIKAGAVWPASAVSSTAAPKDGKYVISQERRAFWSFQPLKDVKVPTVKDPRWSKTNIDRLVMAKLEQEGMKPVKAASKRDLLRRAYLDLTGLPPTMEEIAAFEKDASPDAFSKIVDKLLASPQYGERWGRIWLDVARYGEDDYRSLNPNPRGYYPYQNPYLYRDWVIQAMNDDLSYDMFVKAQLAGDLLDEKLRYKMLPATGFLGLGPWYFDNGAVEVTRADERHDRIDVVTRGFLGLTVACARCHDHKYDPIPQTDYYSLGGVFLNTIYHEYPAAPKSVVEDYLRIQDEIERKQKVQSDFQNDQANQLAAALVLQTANYLQGVWEVAGPQKKDFAQVVEQRKLDYELLDRWVKYMAKPMDKYKYKDAWQAMMKKGGTAQEAKRLAEEFQENLNRVMLTRKGLDEENQIIIAKSLEGTKPKKRANKPNEFITNDDFCPGCGLQLKGLPEDDNSFYTEIFQRELSDDDDPAMMNGGRQQKPGVLLFRGWGLEQRIGAEARAELENLRKDIDALRKKVEPGYQFIHGVKDAEEPKDLELAIRGVPTNLGPKVPRHFLSIFSEGDPKPFSQGSGRLELAEDIVKQPIAMRVIVNRIWKGHFGTGIVDTPSNFGMGGERPTNPDLLEYLASDFVKNGMSLKKLHKELMMTAVYQLSTDNDEANFAKDASNRFYWRADRKRLDAEQLRDSVLYVSGNLDRAMGGPSSDLTPSFDRRTVYGKVSRYKLDEYLQLFDFPTPAISAEKRFATTVPLQRLFLMNSDFMQIEAENLAKRVAAEADNSARVRKAYQLIYGRDATDQEVQLGLEYLRTEPMREYEEAKKKAAEQGAGKRGAKKDAPAEVSKMAKPEADKVESSGSAPAATAAVEAKAVEAKAGEGKAVDAKPAPVPMEVADAAPAAAEGAAEMPMGMGMGMMGGVPGARRGAGGAPEVKYEPTAWGRYVKILLSSSEFLFVN